MIMPAGTEYADEIVNLINTRESVYAIYVMEPAVCRKVEADELAITSPGYVVDNVAIKQMIPKNRKYCVFSKGFLEPANDRMVVLEDKVYGLCGHDVPPDMKDSVPDDAVWVADTFVMYPDKISGEEVRMKLLPYPLTFLNASEGISGALAYNPSLATNEYLRDLFGFDGPKAATSTMVALNYNPL